MVLVFMCTLCQHNKVLCSLIEISVSVKMDGNVTEHRHVQKESTVEFC